MALVATAAMATLLVVRVTGCGKGPPAFEAPPELLRASTVFPGSAEPLQPSVPLAPLLARDEPDRLTVLEPGEGALHLWRGTPIVIRFNRPMVDGARVGKPLDTIPLSFTPKIEGKATWSTRSSLLFEPAPASWDKTRTVRMTLSGDLRSLANESIDEFEPRSAVFDATPRYVAASRQSRLSPGEPLRLAFDGKVETGWLSSRMLAYEVGGGQRTLDFSLAGKAPDDEGRYPVEVRWREQLEPGARVAVALAPSISGRESDPLVLEYELMPKPKIEGFACGADAADVSGCELTESPGAVIDIGESLVMIASTPLGEVPMTAIAVTPVLPGLQLRVEDERRVVVKGDFAPGQVYQVRFSEWVDKAGVKLARTPPLAIRSAGRPPEIRTRAGRLAYERDARAELPFALIAPDKAVVQIEDVPEGQEFLPIVGLADRFSDDRKGRWKEFPLAPLAPSARANRWGDGKIGWREPWTGVASNMALISLVPDRDKPGASSRSTAFVQSTDLGLEAMALDRGVLAWLTSIAGAQPIGGAKVTVADMAGREVGDGVTDANGAVWIAQQRNPTTEGVVVLAKQGNDRAIIVLDARTAMGPGQLSVGGGAVRPDNLPVASVFTDREACRPGETVHVKAILRKVEGASLAQVKDGDLQLSLLAPTGLAAVADKRVAPTRFGTASMDFDIPSDAQLGPWRIEVRRDGVEQPLAVASFTVGEFRQPVFRVDLQKLPDEAVDGDQLQAGIDARFLFGAPAAGARATWTLTRSPGGRELPPRWAEYAFTPVDAQPRAGTLDSGELTLGPDGTGSVSSRIAISAPGRETDSLEVTIRDMSGKTTSARGSVDVFPARFEAGLHERPGWAEHGATLDIAAVVVDHDGNPVSGRPIEASIVREGWHTYWEWAGHGVRRGDDGDGEDSGAFQSRRSRRREVVHTCKLVSAAEPAHCLYAPSRPGTYVLEVSTKDDDKHASIASQRVYVAGPDERPDRDPPGSAITVTPTKREWRVGETAELAVESPFPEAELLVAVERDTVLFTERRRVAAGGQVLRIPLTASMVPNAFVSVTLVRPRSGPPAADVDVNSPDWRVGMTELGVLPAEAPVDVTLGLPSADVAAGARVPIEVHVRDAEGRGMAAEVALYAVDEGTLRLTGYITPDPMDGLFPRRPASFIWEGIRRSLVSRIEQSLLPGPGGDGGGSSPSAPDDIRDKFEPTPLWLPSLVTDASGNARAEVQLPRRAARYRVMAVAVDEGMRSGHAEGWIQARRPVVPRTALPRFVTQGDRFEAAVLLHNGSDSAVDATVTTTVAGQARGATPVHIEAGREARAAQWVDAGAQPIAFRFVIQSGADTETIEETVPVELRARRERAESVGAVSGASSIAVQMPADALDADGHMNMTVASHPFVAFDMSIEALGAFPYGGVEPLASSILGLAAYASLDTGRRPASASPKELEVRAAKALKELTALQNGAGSFGWYSANDQVQPYTTAFALHAMVAARKAGWKLNEDSVKRATEALSQLVQGSSFLDGSADQGRNDLAFALRVLAEAGEPQDARVTALFEQRELLSPYGLAQLAMAMENGDRRRDALVVEAQNRVLATREDERQNPAVLRWYESSTRTIGAVLEASSRVDAGMPKARLLASKILAARASEDGSSWWSTHETSCALAGLAAYAQRFREGRSIKPQVLVDGNPVKASESRGDIAWYTLPFGALARGGHKVEVKGDGLMFYALSGAWWTPLGEQDQVPRGRVATLHRVLETESGARIESGSKVHLGDLVRVRLFTYDEKDTPPFVVLRDHLAGGLEPVQDAFETNPQESLRALLGMGPDDDAVDPRGFHALRSIGDVELESIGDRSVVLHLRQSGPGLREFTYGVRASTAGRFTLAPAVLEAIYVPGYTARSDLAVIEVEP